MEAPLALYRRYRPDTFSQVIGQDHVTEPLRAALRNNRVNHAYLFSGPRGCGKTTSARILARALNCAQGPTEEPCGTCDSCRELATGGPGSVDVIEIDAASHGGVDDARDLREQATFRPMRDRFKIYIIDEAHMVSTQGFNALLKIVEEPPEHVRFIFATTEPEKVIGTVRSRTHHYPFRLIPPRVLSDYLAELCRREGVQIDPAALPLVVRAGGGSARDTLSVLDQLIGGAGPEGVTYELTAGLLGFTPDALLDEVIDAFAAQDGGAVFAAVDRVIETGQDPRRFTEDLLRRLRDLVVISAVPDASASGLIDVPEDQAERLVAQAARFGRHDLSRAADLVAAGLDDLKGTTAPRLLLELLCARILLPGADHGSEGLAARIDRLEKRMSMAPPTSPPASAPAESAGRAEPRPSPAAATPQRPGSPAVAEAPAAPASPGSAASESSAPSTPQPQSQPESQAQHKSQSQPQAQAQPPAATPSGQEWPSARPAGGAQPGRDPQEARRPEPAPEPEPAGPAPRQQPPLEGPASGQQGQPGGAAGGLTLTDVRRLWPEIVEAVKSRRRVTWIQLSQHAQAVALEGNQLTLGFNNPGARESFVNGRGDEILRQTVIDLIGQDWRVDAIVDPSAQPGTEPQISVTRPAVTSPPPGDPAPGEQAPGAGQVPADAPPARSQPRPPSPEVTRSAREAIQPTRPGGAVERPGAQDGPVDEDADRDDPDVDDSLAGAELLTERLGAQVIEEIPHN